MVSSLHILFGIEGTTQSLFPMSWLSGLYSSEIQTNWRGERNQLHNKPNITKPSHHSIASHYINHSALMNSKYTTHLFGSQQGSTRSQSSEWLLNAGFLVNSRKKINIAVSSHERFPVFQSHPWISELQILFHQTSTELFQKLIDVSPTPSPIPPSPPSPHPRTSEMPRVSSGRSGPCFANSWAAREVMPLGPNGEKCPGKTDQHWGHKWYINIDEW